MVVARRGALSARRGIGRGGISGPALFAHGNKGRGCWRGAGSRVHEFEQTDQGEEARLTETQPGADRRCSVALRWPGADSAARPARFASWFASRPARIAGEARCGCPLCGFLRPAGAGTTAAPERVRPSAGAAGPECSHGAGAPDRIIRCAVFSSGCGSRGCRLSRAGTAGAGWCSPGRTVGVQGPGVCRCGFTGRAAGKRFFPAGPVTGPGLSVGCGSSVAASCAEGGAGAVRHRRPAMAAVACVTIDRLRVQPNGRSGPGACRGSAGDARTGLRGGRDEPPERAEPQGAVAHPEEKRSDETGKSQQAPARQERRRRQ